MYTVAKWNDDRPRQVYELALLGATEAQIARVMNVDEKTIEYWKATKPEFLEQLNQGRMVADAKVAHALYQRAVGCSVPETRTVVCGGKVIKVKVEKYFPPDSWAANKWLSIRQRQLWADVQRTEITQTNININKLDFDDIAPEELEMLYRIGMKHQLKAIGDN